MDAISEKSKMFQRCPNMPSVLSEMAVPEYWFYAGLATVFIVSAVKYAQRTRYHQLGSRIPGPVEYPLLGSILSLKRSKDNILKYLVEQHSRFGSVFRVWLGLHLVVFLKNPLDISVIFNSSRSLSKPIIYKPFTLVFGSSLFTAETKVWNKFRKIMNPAFTNQVIDSYVSVFYEKSLDMVDRLEKVSDNGPFDVAEYTSLCSLQMVVETSLGVTIDILSENTQHLILNNLLIAKTFACLVLVCPWLCFMRIYKLAQLHKDIFYLIKTVDGFVDTILTNKINLNLSSQTKPSVHSVKQVDPTTSKQRLGFLDHMLTTLVDNPKLFTAEELRDQTILILGAATDTTAFVVACTLMLLGLHEDVQIKVLREQECIFGKDINRPVTATDLKQMVYLEQVINETMRLYPPAPIVGRRVDEDVTINGYVLPAGNTCFISIFLAHRDPTYFPEPGKFDPDRFDKENSCGRPPCSFIPFVSGRRICIGKYYAYLAMKTMLSVVLRRYQVLEYGSREDMECFRFEILLRMVNGQNIKLQPRKSAILCDD